MTWGVCAYGREAAPIAHITTYGPIYSCQFTLATPCTGAHPSGLGSMPTSGILGALRLRSHPLSSAAAPISSWTALTSSTPTSRMDPFLPKANLGEHSKATDTIVVTPGIPALKCSMVDLILSRKYVDLGELPPAKGFSKLLSSLSSGLEGQVVLLQAADLVLGHSVLPSTRQFC